MNSPVSCLPDPIQNMAPLKKTKKKNTSSNNAPPRPLRTSGVRAPAAMGGITSKAGSTMPVFAGIGRKMVVQNYEAISVLKNVPTNTFALLQTSQSVNPGIASTFPWLSTIALNYSKYKFKMLRFIYVPNVPTSIGGSAYIYLSYDSTDQQPASLANVAVADSSSIGPAWVGGGINAEKAFRPNLGIDECIFVDADVRNFTQPYYYVRTQAKTDTDSTPLVLYFGSDSALNGTANYGGTGTVYVSYTVELFEPVLASLNL
jgi:hypothetical protein